MKKITLLVVAAVFVIGMQSCSTEEVNSMSEDLLLENLELQSKNEESNKNRSLKLIDLESKSCSNCISVFFRQEETESQRNSFRELMKQIIFETIVIDQINSCGTKETWIVEVMDGRTLNDLTTGDDLTLEKKSKFSEKKELVISTPTKEEADDPDHPNSIRKYSASWVSDVILLDCNPF